MVATAEDVGIFLRALNDGSLLTDDEQAIYSSIYEYGHTGLLPGYYSIARYHKEIDTVVVQFVNTTGGTPIASLFDTGGGTKVMVSNVVYNRIVQILLKSIHHPRAAQSLRWGRSAASRGALYGATNHQQGDVAELARSNACYLYCGWP